MIYLVWIRGHDRLTPQLWAERSYAVDRRAEAARIAAFYELAPERAMLPLGVLAGLYPPPEATP